MPSPYYIRVAAKRLEAQSIEELAELWDCALVEGDDVDFRRADGSLLDRDEFGRLLMALNEVRGRAGADPRPEHPRLV